MRIKKFRAKTIQEGKEKIFLELGEEAIVLSTRIIPPSPPDMEEMIELVAAIDSDLPSELKHKTQNSKPLDQQLSKSDILNITSEILKEISSLKSLFWNLSDKITYYFITKFEAELQQLGKLMSKNGFTNDFLFNTLYELSAKKYKDFEELRLFATKQLSQKLNYAKSLEKTNFLQKIAFIGPTGCGKTLTLIKIAFLLKLLLNARVAIVSADTLKVGGWEHLQILCAVANLPCSFAQSKEELLSTIDDYKKFDFILIDTSGGSPRDENFLSELSEFVHSVELTEILLVIPVTTSANSFKEAVSVFKKFEPTKMVLTKFDEVTTIGHIYEGLLSESQKVPLIYFTNGINIPNSIEPAEPEFIAKFLINYLE